VLNLHVEPLLLGEFYKLNFLWSSVVISDLDYNYCVSDIAHIFVWESHWCDSCVGARQPRHDSLRLQQQSSSVCAYCTHRRSEQSKF